MILMIDNYDSFTYNLVQYLSGFDEEVMVRRNDEITIDEIKAIALKIYEEPNSDSIYSVEAVDIGKEVHRRCLGMYQRISSVNNVSTKKSRSLRRRERRALEELING